ncbi:MAG: helix-turn-helix domain-containing protein [Rhodobacteraceae bacterium]|nr:helix-turn-helix domain-containing protein [Paracoccaceae bacterium]
MLKADVSAEGGGWDDARIAEALETSVSTVYRTRRQLVEEGLEAALARKKQKAPSTSTIFDGEAEAKLIALACSAARQRMPWHAREGSRPRAMRAGLCVFWKSAWWNWASSRRSATARSTGCSKV